MNGGGGDRQEHTEPHRQRRTKLRQQNVTIGELAHASKHAYNRRNHSAIAVRKISVPMVHLTTVLSLLSLFTTLLINNKSNTWNLLIW